MGGDFTVAKRSKITKAASKKESTKSGPDEENAVHQETKLHTTTKKKISKRKNSTKAEEEFESEIDEETKEPPNKKQKKTTTTEPADEKTAKKPTESALLSRKSSSTKKPSTSLGVEDEEETEQATDCYIASLNQVAGRNRKTFCANGRIGVYDETFFVSPADWNKQNLLPLVKAKRFFTMLAPSQTGKTTRATYFVQQLEVLGYHPI